MRQGVDDMKQNECNECCAVSRDIKFSCNGVIPTLWLGRIPLVA